MMMIVTRPLFVLLLLASMTVSLHAQATDPARVAAAKDLMAAMNVQDQFHKSTTAMKDLLISQMQAEPGGDKVKTLMDKIFDPNSDGIKTYFADAETAYITFFAERFTPEEMKEIAAFQSSAVGRKMQGAMPDMIAALGPPLAKFQEHIKKAVVEEFQAKPKP